MSNAERKARKRAGVPVEAKPEKVATPVADRAMFNRQVLGLKGTKYQGRPVAQSTKKLQRELDARTGGEAA